MRTFFRSLASLGDCSVKLCVRPEEGRKYSPGNALESRFDDFFENFFARMIPVVRGAAQEPSSVLIYRRAAPSYI